MKKVGLIVFAACAVSAAVFSACEEGDGGGSTPDAAAAGDGSSSSSSSGSSGGSLDADTPCSAFAQAICNRLARCSPLFIDVAFGNLDSCKEGYAIVCDRMTRAPGAVSIPASCIDALGNGCGEVDPALSVCRPKGSLTDGTACEFDGQCASGRCGSAGGTPGCGLCKPASDAAAYTPEGGGCDNEGNCERGLSCIGAEAGTAGEPGRGTCQKTRALGEACLDAEDCNTGSHGDFGWMSFTVACLDGGCAKPLDEGATCRPQVQYAYSCDVQKKLRCELVVNDAGTFSGQCNKWPFAKANEPCTKNNQTPSGSCYGDNRCVGDAGTNGGTCVPKGPVGSPCSVDYDCRFGMSCISGACTILPPDHCK
jgi:hypothetical protein